MPYEYISRIEFLMERKKFDEAQVTLAEAFTQYPNTGLLQSIQAQIFYHKDNYKKALEAINQAISLEPDRDHHYFWKAQIQLQLSKFDDAIKSINEALRIDPEDADFYGLKSVILLQQDKKREAITCAKQGLSRSPDNGFCINALSMALGSSGQVAESSEVLEALLADDPENPLTQANMGYTYLRKGNIPKAKEHFGAALVIDPLNEYTRAGMMEAIKGTNVLYRKILAYAVWMEAKTSGNRWAFIIGLVVVVKILPFLMPFYLIFLLWVWFAPPIANAVLYFDKNGKYLMTKQTRLITEINIGLIGTAIISVALLTPVVSYSFLGLAFAAFITIIPVYMYEEVSQKKNKIAMLSFSLLFLGLGLGIVSMSLAGMDAKPLWVGLFGGGIIFTWVSSFFMD
ncbi:tetratricopeptide repeat protein [Owenweeksia hongkongensis]|uniref:tetratricopeptide repeat protein n=1 Tax=Owenweeksia hongkongensis TaxID=253245 RepID=UPI003A9167BB